MSLRSTYEERVMDLKEAHPEASRTSSGSSIPSTPRYAGPGG